jgi:hypothetical protein
MENLREPLYSLFPNFESVPKKKHNVKIGKFRANREEAQQYANLRINQPVLNLINSSILFSLL